MVNNWVSEVRAHDFDEWIFPRNIGDATFSFSGYDSSGDAMHRASCVSISGERGQFRAGSRAPMSPVSRWTGRARVSDVTNTMVPRCLATATHRTRVSEMRHQPSRMDMPLGAAPIHRETNNFERGGPGTPLY